MLLTECTTPKRIQEWKREYKAAYKKYYSAYSDELIDSMVQAGLEVWMTEDNDWERTTPEEAVLEDLRNCTDGGYFA